MKIKHCGVIDVLIDDDNQAVTFDVKRSPRKADHLGAGSMANVASWALSVATKTGYTVDTTPIDLFLERD